MDEPVEFRNVSWRGGRITEGDLSGMVIRAVEIAGTEIDAPWLCDGDNALVVNGVDVAGYVDAELDRLFPGRTLRRASDPTGLREAWAAVESAWQEAIARALAMPPGAVDVSVDGEWSFSQTVRHLLMATDTWLGRAILEIEQPYHPLGQPNVEYAEDGYDTSVFASGIPAFDSVLEARAERVAMVRDFLGSVSSADLAAPRRNPWAPAHEETVLSCVQVILNEEWEHLRYAVRDLDVLAARAGSD